MPGASCHLVVIDRIPFPRPDDPLVARPVEGRRADHGGNGFTAVSVPRAALLLAQGVGRLIRSVDDRGVVAVLDPRLATARYGDYLRAPAAVLVHDRLGRLVRRRADPPRRARRHPLTSSASQERGSAGPGSARLHGMK